MIRLGLCCHFLEVPIRFRTTTVRYISTLEEPLLYFDQLIHHNLNSLERAIDYCASHKIGAFRINSSFFPIYTHPKYGYHLEELPTAHLIKTKCQSIQKQTKEKKIRLTFHPDQFVVLNSPKEDVVERAIADLEYHTQMATLLGADVVNIHGGGGYGDKSKALKQFARNFKRLSKNAQNILTIENDDRIFTPEDLLPLCLELGIPLVYDAHHHRCLKDTLSIAKATEEALQTWNREPLFHISSPKNGWKSTKPHLHHDMIQPDDMPKEWKKIEHLTVDIEAKGKEKALLALRKTLLKQGWNL